MADEYTPTTEQVRSVYQLDPFFKKDFRRRGREFDRWLVAHDREVEAKALRDAAALVYADWSGGHAYEGVARQEVEDWLNDRADRIELQASEKGASDGEQ